MKKWRIGRVLGSQNWVTLPRNDDGVGGVPDGSPLITVEERSRVSPIYPDLQWYASVSERKNLNGRCPFATVHRCPRYFESVALLGDQGIATQMSRSLHDELLKRWSSHELWPATGETANAISGGERPNSFSNFCPEVLFDTFKLFASVVIQFYDSDDRALQEGRLEREGTLPRSDWRWNFQHVEPMHYSECPLYSKLVREKTVSQITINGNVSGQVNIAGETITSPVLNLAVGEVLARVEASNASPAEKSAVKSKFQEFLTHPVVAAIIGGLAGRVG